MKLQIFSVYDLKAEQYNVPFYMNNTKAAERVFGDAANEEGHMFNKHPVDYCLFHIGEFDDDTGIIETFEVFKSLGMANEYIHTTTQEAKK